MSQQITRSPLDFTRQFSEQAASILTEQAIDFLSDLVSQFTPARNQLLAERKAIQANIVLATK